MKPKTHKEWQLIFNDRCVDGDLESIKMLCGEEFKVIARPHYKDNYEFKMACMRGNLELIKFLTTDCKLLESGHGLANIHADHELGFQWACRWGHRDVIKFLTTSKELVEAGHSWVDIHTNEEYGFQLACSEGHLEIVKFLTRSSELVDAGHSWVDVQAGKDRAFQWACQNERWNVVEYLIFDLKIKKTQEIEAMIKQYPQVECYFNAREEKEQWNLMMNGDGRENNLKELEVISKLKNRI